MYTMGVNAEAACGHDIPSDDPELSMFIGVKQQPGASGGVKTKGYKNNVAKPVFLRVLPAGRVKFKKAILA